MVMGRLSMARSSDYGIECYGSNVPRYRINKIFNAMSETVEKSYFHTLQMRNALLQIEDQMVHSNWMPDVIMGVNRGGVIPGVYLSHRINRRHIPVDVRLRDHVDTNNLDALYRAIDKGEKVLIIDDINDTGQHLSILDLTVCLILMSDMPQL
jgi:adenine/guanine phosphoribosyltransferase-like PRPP-binding protein